MDTRLQVILHPTLESQGKGYSDVCIDRTNILTPNLSLHNIGDVLALMGEKTYAPEFWQAIKFTDENGRHHIREFPEDIQAQLNAVWAWKSEQPNIKYVGPTDVTPQIEATRNILNAVLDETHPKHDFMIQKGEEWKEKMNAEIESKLVSENQYVRVFKTDGISCSDAYYSPEQDAVIPATIVFNEKLKNITIAFEDGNKTFSPDYLGADLWNRGLIDKDDIAISPEGKEMNWINLDEACAYVEGLFQLKDLANRLNEYVKALTPAELSQYDALSCLVYNTTHKSDENMIEDMISSLPYETKLYFTILGDEITYDSVIGMEMVIPCAFELDENPLDGCCGLEPNSQVYVKYCFTDEEKNALMNSCIEREYQFEEEEFSEQRPGSDDDPTI